MRLYSTSTAAAAAAAAAAQAYRASLCSKVVFNVKAPWPAGRKKGNHSCHALQIGTGERVTSFLAPAKSHSSQSRLLG